jgi:type III pantothenate kinase
MILLVDIGNTRTKYTLLKDIDSKCFTEIIAVDNRLFDSDYITRLCSHYNKVTQVVAACVANDEIIDKIENYCIYNNMVFCRVTTELSTCSVTSGYDNPLQLGVDRWLAIIAGQKLYPQKNVLVIDAGTATTIDLVDSSGKHLGGWIFAGISLLFTSLLGDTEKIRADVKKEVSLSFGLNTTDNVNNSSWAATVGLVKQAISQAKTVIGEVDEVIITGGNGKALHTLMNIESVYIEDLIFYGLSEYIK